MKLPTQPLHSIVLLFIFSFCLFSFFSSGVLESEDGWLYSSVARNIYYNHQAASAPDDYPKNNVHMNTTKGKDGIWRAPGSLGYSISLVPAVAISDLLHRMNGSVPPQYFPLQNDWSFHLFASFTNTFWGAVLVVILFLYANELGFSKRYSYIFALSTILCTNLLPLTKFSFAHMMFTSCAVASFYFIKCFTKKHQIRFLVLAGISYFLLKISYNITYFLPLIPLCIYLIALEKPNARKKAISIIVMLAVVITIIFPDRVTNLLGAVRMSPKVLFEGVVGFLFSAGKSIFLYSPPLVLIPIYWNKIQKKIYPELIATTLLFFCYLYFVGSASIMDHNMPSPIWHGGMAWGPRYLAPIIPFAMILIFYIVMKLNKLQKMLIVTPLFVLGFFVQVIGTSVIYLLQYRDIPYNIFVGKAELTVYDYASFIPRYSPIISQTRSFVANLISFPQTINRGTYQVRFFDGFDMPLHTGDGVFRGLRQEGHVSFVNNSGKPMDVSLTLFNAPDDSVSSASAKLQLLVDYKEIKTLTLPPQKEGTTTISINTMKGATTILTLNVTYDRTIMVPHVIYIKKMSINDSEVNLASLDYPNVSTLGSYKKGVPYRYYGGKISDNWRLWDLRARISERTLDFWWIKNLYYWDKPQNLIWIAFIIDIIVCTLSGYSLFRKQKLN